MARTGGFASRWTDAFERRVALYEEYALCASARLEQLMRESERGVGPLPAPLPPVACGEQLETGVVVCAACRRDHHTEPGPELMTAEDAPICWACGRAGEPLLAAEVLASATDHAERAALDICHTASGFLVELIRERGVASRADAFEGQVEQIQGLLRESRRRGLASPERWLELGPALPAIARAPSDRGQA